MIIKSDLELCKDDIEKFLGHLVRITSHGGRKKTIVREGVLESCYPNIFMVRCKIENTDRTEIISYSYIDILTKNVTVDIVTEQN